MAKQIKVGVVGCGYWGPNLIRNFRAIPDCSLTVMCDLNEKRLAHLKSFNSWIPPIPESALGLSTGRLAMEKDFTLGRQTARMEA